MAAGDKRENVKRLPLGIFGVLVGMVVVSFVVAFWDEGWMGFWQSLNLELAGAVVTYVLLDLVLGRRRRREDLIAQMGERQQRCCRACC